MMITIAEQIEFQRQEVTDAEDAILALGWESPSLVEQRDKRRAILATLESVQEKQ